MDVCRTIIKGHSQDEATKIDKVLLSRSSKNFSNTFILPSVPTAPSGCPISFSFSSIYTPLRSRRSKPSTASRGAPPREGTALGIPVSGAKPFHIFLAHVAIRKVRTLSWIFCRTPSSSANSIKFQTF